MTLHEETVELYCYNVIPMDWGWDWLPTVKEFYSKLAKSTPDLPDPNFSPLLSSDIADAENFVMAALKLGREIGWEGDFRSYARPRVVVLPNENAPKLALVWKQDNNGQTFVVSQCELKWLGEPELVRSAGLGTS
jgi:hypothetical protein